MCYSELGSYIISKLYTVCIILAVVSLTFIIIVFRTAWSGIVRLLDVPSMLAGDIMGNGCCKSRQGMDYSKDHQKHNELAQGGTLVNDLIEKNTALEHENCRLEEKVNVLEKELEERTNEWTEMFGKDIERRAKGNFNNTSDPVQPIDISKRCEGMFDEEWRDVMVNFFKDDEEYGIGFLSEILKDCQTFCQATADKQLAIFTNPCSPSDGRNADEILISKVDVHNLYKIRRQIGQHKSTKDAVIECFYDKVRERESVRNIIDKLKQNQTEILEPDETENHESSHETEDHEPNNETENQESHHEMVESHDGVDEHVSEENENSDSESRSGSSDPSDCLDVFIKNCTDMCWQAAISDPPVSLKFDVIGCHIDDIKSKFYEYPSKLLRGVGEHNTVKTVVWPAVVKTCSGGREVLIANRKGCVLLYDNKNI